MNYGLILAGGVGQRMRNSGIPKQFLKVLGKPIIIYTLEKFVNCSDIDKIVIVCNPYYIDHMNSLLVQFQLGKEISVIHGGKDRQSSIKNGFNSILECKAQDDDIIVIHDGVRPLIEESVISENIEVAKKYGSAMTVKAVVESVVITNGDFVKFDDFKKRDDTYSLTSPQTFTVHNLRNVFKTEFEKASIPILDVALAYTYLGNGIHIVKENNQNIKITTPEDYYYLKGILELNEQKYIFGI